MQTHITLTLLLTLNLLIRQDSYGQTVNDTLKNKPTNYFENFDFSNGNWKLFGIADYEHTPDEEEQYKIYEMLGHFYTNDLAVLQQIKDDLTPQNKEPRGYASTYELMLYKNDTLQISVRVNMDDDFVKTDNRNRYVCKPNLIKNLVGKVKKIPMTDYVFPTLEEARKAYPILSGLDSVLIFPHEPYMVNKWDWLTYDGCSKILYVDSIKKFDLRAQEVEIKKSIKKDCPNEKYLLTTADGHNGVGTPSKLPEQNYWIISNEKLGKSLKTYKTVKPWTKFSNIKIWVYGLTKDQIDQLMNR